MNMSVYIESNDILLSSLHSFFPTVLRKTNSNRNMSSKDDDNDGKYQKKHIHTYKHT